MWCSRKSENETPITMRRKLASPIISLLLLLRPFSSATTKTTGSTILTADELTEVNAVIERLGNSNHFQEAIRLLSVSLLALPSPPHPLPSSLPFLIHLLSSSSSSTSTPSIFFLLSTLRHHNPPPSSPALPFSSRLLVSSLLHHRRLHDASSVFSWLLRDDSPCRPDAETYRVFVRGLCDERRNRGGGSSAVDVLRAAREMVRDGIEVGEEVRGLVWRSLLTEARVEEAREIDAALAAVNSGGDGKDGVGELMDRIIREWQD